MRACRTGSWCSRRALPGTARPTKASARSRSPLLGRDGTARASSACGIGRRRKRVQRSLRLQPRVRDLLMVCTPILRLCLPRQDRGGRNPYESHRAPLCHLHPCFQRLGKGMVPGSSDKSREPADAVGQVGGRHISHHEIKVFLCLSPLSSIAFLQLHCFFQFYCFR